MFLPSVGAEYSYKDVPTAVSWAAYEVTTAICKLTNKMYNQASGSRNGIDKESKSSLGLFLNVDQTQETLPCMNSRTAGSSEITCGQEGRGGKPGVSGRGELTQEPGVHRDVGEDLP